MSVEMSQGTSSLSQQLVHEVLRNDRRIGVIARLADAGGTITKADLADAIAAAEQDCSIGDAHTADRNAVYVSLHQTHLPMLDDNDVIEYDTQSGAIEAGDHFKAVCAAYIAVASVVEPQEEP